MKVDTKYNLYEGAYLGNFPKDSFYLSKFKRLPKQIYVSEVNHFDVHSYMQSQGFKETVWEKRYAQTHLITDGSVAYIKGDVIVDCYFSTELNQEKTEIDQSASRISISLYYSKLTTELENIVSFLQKKIYVPTKKGKISLIVKRGNSLDTQSFKVKMEAMDVELNYGSKFKEAYDRIVKRLNTKDDKGIVLLHGTPGTGKSSLIKYLTKQIQDKEVIFIPPYLSEAITSPEFLPFLMEHSNSILVIEDAERVLMSREEMGSSSTGTSNILNLTDGIIGECLNIQIIATFNTEKSKIDQALLRPGRLICEWEFKALDVEDSNRLLKHLGKDFTANKPMTLAEIYNQGEDLIKSQTERRAIGFNSNR